MGRVTEQQIQLPMRWTYAIVFKFELLKRSKILKIH
jgi:hypothetical protein